MILFIVPYIILFSIYIQLNGEVSPGGGFQAGVIFATGIIAFDLINDSKKTHQFFSEKILTICRVFGVLIYASTGLVSLLFDDNFLEPEAIYLADLETEISSLESRENNNLWSSNTDLEFPSDDVIT